MLRPPLTIPIDFHRSTISHARITRWSSEFQPDLSYPMWILCFSRLSPSVSHLTVEIDSRFHRIFNVAGQSQPPLSTTTHDHHPNTMLVRSPLIGRYNTALCSIVSLLSAPLRYANRCLTLPAPHPKFGRYYIPPQQRSDKPIIRWLRIHILSVISPNPMRTGAVHFSPSRSVVKLSEFYRAPHHFEHRSSPIHTTHVYIHLFRSECITIELILCNYHALRSVFGDLVLDFRSVEIRSKFIVESRSKSQIRMGLLINEHPKLDPACTQLLSINRCCYHADSLRSALKMEPNYWRIDTTMVERKDNVKSGETHRNWIQRIEFDYPTNGFGSTSRIGDDTHAKRLIFL